MMVYPFLFLNLFVFRCWWLFFDNFKNRYLCWATAREDDENSHPHPHKDAQPLMLAPFFANSSAYWFNRLPE